MTFSAKTRALLAASALLAPGLALAQATVPDAANTTASPGRVQEQMMDREFQPSVSPRVEVRDIVMQKAPDGAENITFTLDTVQIDGVTVYEPGALESLYAAKLGSTVSLADMYVLANDMTNKYRNDGYILTQVIIPPQTIEGGKIQFKVVEGYVGNVTVTGNEEFDALGLIRDYAEKIKTDTRALNVSDLERYLLLINDLPGVEARSVLSPSPNQVGAAELQIIVQRDLYDAFLGIDNFGSRYLGPVQATAVGTLNSYFRNNETITLQAVYAPNENAGPELAFGSVIFTQPIGNEGTLLELIGSYTSTKPGYTLDDFNVEGRSKFASAKVEHPFIRSRSANLYGHIGLDWRNVTTTNLIEADRKDDIRALRIGGRAEILDTLLGVGINSISVEMGQGLEILGSSNDTTPNLSRADGRPDFTKFEAEIQRLQKITESVNLLLGARGQYSADSLLASEEFGVGGINYGRGFDSSEIVGDSGFAGKVEVQWKEPLETDFFQSYQVYTFFDAGRTFNPEATINSQVTDTLTSTGVGLRADFMEDTKMGLAVAVPLNRDVETQQDQGPRVYFNLSRSF